MKKKCVLVEVLDAVDVVGRVHGERDAVQAAVTHHAGEAVRVVGLPRRPQDALHDGFAADGAGLQGVLCTHTHTELHNRPSMNMLILLSHLETRGPLIACLQLALV